MLHHLIKNCRQQAADCTEEEIIHFIKEKALLVQARHSRIYNPIGFLLTAVPKCLAGEAFRLYREEQTRRRESEAAYELRCQVELDEWRKNKKPDLRPQKIPSTTKNSYASVSAWHRGAGNSIASRDHPLNSTKGRPVPVSP